MFIIFLLFVYFSSFSRMSREISEIADSHLDWSSDRNEPEKIRNAWEFLEFIVKLFGGKTFDLNFVREKEIPAREERVNEVLVASRMSWFTMAKINNDTQLHLHCVKHGGSKVSWIVSKVKWLWSALENWSYRWLIDIKNVLLLTAASLICFLDFYLLATLRSFVVYFYFLIKSSSFIEDQF